mgnify:CR=1 FL=1
MNNRVVLPVLSLIVVAVIAFTGYTKRQSYLPDPSGPRQAIFLIGGQEVYFGYASSLRNQVVVLTDVYYIQAQQQPIQPSDTKTTIPNAPEINLVKLGNELHGPKDRMEINRDRIAFIEDMKDDSKINEAIKAYINKNSQPTK